MVFIVFIACILASAFNAGSSLLEREAAGAPEMGELFSRQLTMALARNRKFLLGLLFQVFAVLMELVALKKGSLVIIGPLLTLDMVFLWLFLGLRHKLRITLRNWLAVILLVVGLSLLFLSTQPKAGYVDYDPLAWLIAIGVFALVVGGAFAVTKLYRSPRLQAASLGVAAAYNYALDAGLVKLVFNQLKTHDLLSLFFFWPFYALLAFAVFSIVLTQNVLRAGPLFISQPIIEVGQAVASSAIGIFIFGDILQHTWLSVIGDIVSVLLASTGIYILATTDNLFSPK